MEKNRRRIILIDRRFQGIFLLRNTLFFVLFALIIGGGIYLSMWYSITKEFSSVRISQDLKTIGQMGPSRDTIEMIPLLKEQAKFLSTRQREVLGAIMSRTNRKLLPVLGLLTVFVLFASLIISHRIAGPVYRFKRLFNAITKEGDLTLDYSLRDKDELKDLAGEIGAAIQRLSTTLKEIGHQVRSMKGAVSGEEIDRQLQKVESMLAEFRFGK
ncbi:MAG: hypothetical protein ACYC5N_09455 [Endomicrobiales bacterium]